jgi:DNA-binding NarL/FixJ family response regulator
MAIIDRFKSLSPRQAEIAMLLADGLTNTDIAEKLSMTVHTVKAHRAELMRRMESTSFADLVAQLQHIKSASGKPGTRRASPLRIIVIENDKWYREFLTDNLNERGFIATGVADADGFNLAWAEHPADITILDIELGRNKEDGLSIASKLLKNSSCGVVMVTAKGALDERIKGLSIGADAYFAKPVNIDELTITLTNLGRRVL